jgi:trans-aconitate methyltransferase
VTAVSLAADLKSDDTASGVTTDYPDNPNADLLSRIPPDARTVLDVGCGTGALGAAYRKVNPRARLFGIERDPDAAALAEERLDVVACEDVERNPLPFAISEGIDCLIYGDVLQQLGDPAAVLRSHLKALNPNGSVLICIPNAEHWSLTARLLNGTWAYEETGLLDKRHLRLFTIRTFTRMLAGAGLVIEEVHQRIFAPEQARQFATVLASGLQHVGINPQEYLVRAMPLQYVLVAHKPDAVREPRAPSPPVVSARKEVAAAEIAREIVYFERSQQFAGTSNVEPGPTFTEEDARPFLLPRHTTDVRAFRFSNVVLDTACMLLFSDDQPIKETHYLLHDSEFPNARVQRDRIVGLPADQRYLIGSNRRPTNYYHWLIQAVPAIDWGVRTRGDVLPCIAVPEPNSWQERSLELLGLAAVPRLTLDPAFHYNFPDVEYSEFLNGHTAFSISLQAIETFRRMKAALPTKSSRHPVIYVARTDTKNRTANNEADLISLLPILYLCSSKKVFRLSFLVRSLWVTKLMYSGVRVL